MDNGLAKHTLRQAVWMDPSPMNTARRSPAGSLRSLRSIIKARGAPSFVDSSDYDHKCDSDSANLTAAGKVLWSCCLG
ncbi:hypothetical protein HI914_05687 [Erysiphe necator]|nr:hypothetical protein HI914_05687 [Erysiphe necator]